MAKPSTMLTTWAPPTTIRWTKRSYIASWVGRSLPSAVAYSSSPWSAIHASVPDQIGSRGLAQLPHQGNGAGSRQPCHLGVMTACAPISPTAASVLGLRPVEADGGERAGLPLGDA